jgi:hypothetical protein
MYLLHLPRFNDDPVCTEAPQNIGLPQTFMCLAKIPD